MCRMGLFALLTTHVSLFRSNHASGYFSVNMAQTQHITTNATGWVTFSGFGEVTMRAGLYMAIIVSSSPGSTFMIPTNANGTRCVVLTCSCAENTARCVSHRP